MMRSKAGPWTAGEARRKQSMKGHGNGRSRRPGWVVTVMILALCWGVFAAVRTGSAEEYDPQEAGHPLKLVAYLAFPLGTLLDYGLMRPAFWLVQKEPFRTIFGYEYMAHGDAQAEEEMAGPAREP